MSAVTLAERFARRRDRAWRREAELERERACRYRDERPGLGDRLVAWAESARPTFGGVVRALLLVCVLAFIAMCTTDPHVWGLVLCVLTVWALVKAIVAVSEGRAIACGVYALATLLGAAFALVLTTG